MFVAERFLSDIVKSHGKYQVSQMEVPGILKHVDLNLKHHIHSSYEKNLIERTIQYIKDRIEGFDDYFPCRKKNCKLKHMKKWLDLFAYHYYKELIS